MILDTSGIFWIHPSSQKTPEAPFAIRQGKSGEHLAFGLCIGSATGWEITDVISHTVAHHIAQNLYVSPQTPHNTFVQAAFSARDLLLSQFYIDEEWWPSSTALAGLIQDNHGRISWIGSETAWHFRHASLIAATTPHTLGNALLPHVPELALPPEMLMIPHRLISSQHELDVKDIETLVEPWHLISGDTLVFTTAALTQYLNPQQVAQQLEGKNALQIAQMLMSMLPEGENHVGAAAIVICVKDT